MSLLGYGERELLALMKMICTRASYLEDEALKILEAKAVHGFANRGIQQTERTFVTSLCRPVATDMWS